MFDVRSTTAKISKARVRRNYDHLEQTISTGVRLTGWDDQTQLHSCLPHQNILQVEKNSDSSRDSAAQVGTHHSQL